MNATHSLTLDSPVTPPADGLDMVIEALDHFRLVFTDQLEIGVNMRYCRSLAGVLSSRAQEIAVTTLNTRRKQIIPATPQLSRLKAVAVKAGGEIDSLEKQERTSEDRRANGQRLRLRIAQGHIGDLLNAIRSLESNWGAFDIWIKKPKWATCDRILAALQNGDHDAEEYLDWFLISELKMSGALAPYVAAILWTNNGRKWREWDESSIYPRLIGRARKRRYWDRRDAEWLAPKPNTISLSELDKLPELVSDPLEFLFSLKTPIKLGSFRERSECQEFDGRLTGLNLALEELQYFKLKKIGGLKQIEVQERLCWDNATLQRVKRSTDRKLKEARVKKNV